MSNGNDRSSTGPHADEQGSQGTYVLRELIRDVPLLTTDNGQKAHITCVDVWNDNLYIGTSVGEVLHYVAIPPTPGADGQFSPVSYIFATKLEPAYNNEQSGADAGVKRILLVPDAGKACILCNGTYTFYTLPELSPAFGGQIKQSGCLWIGGLDLDDGSNKGNSKGAVIVICLRQKLRVIRIGEEARRIRDIELGRISVIERRGDLACVADDQTYSLLDVVNQRKIELFPISSSSSIPEPAQQSSEDPRSLPKKREPSRSFSAASPVRVGRLHERNVSLGAATTIDGRLRPDSSSPWPARRSSKRAPSPSQTSSREESPIKTEEQPTRKSNDGDPAADVTAVSENLQPLIVSPTANEFLLTTGTRPSEPGVGMFVNLDGDVVRGTIEFSSYPESLVLDGAESATSNGMPEDADQEGYVLSVVRLKGEEGRTKAIEIQRWDLDPSEAQNTKQWLTISRSTPEHDSAFGTGLRVVSSPVDLAVSAISSSLRLRRLCLKERTSETEADLKRSEEEDRFAARFAQTRAKVLFYHEDRIYWVLRVALVEQLENAFALAVQCNSNDELTVNVQAVQHIINSVRGQDARNELEFMTLTYVRQKASLLLFGNLVLQTSRGLICYEHDKRYAEEALLAGDLDPRCLLPLIPPLHDEIVEGEQGIWLAQGLRDTFDTIRRSFDPNTIVQDAKGAYGDNLLLVMKRYLSYWRKKKGFGSVADEAQVFLTVDAALLHILLMLDQNSPRGPAVAGSVRTELNDVINRGVDCFDRAVELFENYNRLYLLSRLYQSRKNVAQVLATWRRILDGEKDAGGELVDGEQDLRRYLAKIRDPMLVQDYGTWLANRNPKLGVQVFADDSSRVKFEPAEAVAILKEKAPAAVKDYLEYLVFGQNHVQYVNDLIAFYLDTVLHELEQSAGSRQILLDSYETYRALHPPKPTYRQFIEDNAIEADWWHNRLRLLALIGGSHGAASKYDVHTLNQRLAPYSDELVPEMIILNGREGQHEEALRLLTHGLGDYDTAIRYCLLGGSSIFHPSSDLAPLPPMPTKEEQAKLFEHLLHEFFRIEDVDERRERTAELLERFGGWFDVAEVLQLIPDDWSVEAVSGFLSHAFRRLVRERNETVVEKALSSAQNLRQAIEWIEKSEAVGPKVVSDEIVVGQ